MGIFTSKFDVAAIANTESDFVELIMKLGEEELQMDQYVQEQIFNALKVYEKIIEKEGRKGYMSEPKTIALKKLLHQAHAKLKNVPTQRIAYNFSVSESPSQMKQTLLDIKRKMDNNEIKDSETKNFLQTVVATAQNLKRWPRPVLTSEEENDISTLVLRLFLKSAPSKVGDVLDKTLKHLCEVMKNLENLDMKNMSALSVEDVRAKLRTINRKCEDIKEANEKTLESLNMLEIGAKNPEYKPYSAVVSQSTQTHKYSEIGCYPQFESVSEAPTYTLLSSKFTQSSGSRKVETVNRKNILQEMEDKFNDYERMAQEFCAPSSDNVVKKMEEKVDIFLEHLAKVPDEVDIEGKKPRLHQQGLKIIAALHNILHETRDVNHKLNSLSELETKLIEVVGRKSSYQERMNAFRIIAQQLEQIVCSNNEVVIQKAEISNRIQAFMIEESVSHLRQVKEKIDYYQKYARQFAFPQSIDLYDVKRKEIASLKNDVNVVSSENAFIDGRRLMLLQQINETLDILADQGRTNGNIIAALEHLEELQRQLSHSELEYKSDLARLQEVNVMRKELRNVGNFNHRIIRKKIEILSQIHIIEGRIYSSSEEILTFKAVMNNIEKEALKFVHPKSSEAYKHLHKEINTLYSSLEDLKLKIHLNHSYANSLHYNIHSIGRLLNKSADEIETNNEHLHFLAKIDNSIVNISTSHLPIERCDKMKAQLRSLKMSTMKIDILRVIEDTEAKICVEKFKIELIDIRKQLQGIHKILHDIHRPISSTEFMDKIAKIFYLKEYVEDMSEGDVELDSQKQTFIQLVVDVLKLLDEQVGIFVAKRRHGKKVLQLENRFTNFNLDTLNVTKESLEFIHLIRQRAQEFEPQVKSYLGTDSSVDFYVIHENLMRMVEELDRLSCDDQLLVTAVVKTINYVKSLVDQLEANASNE